MGIKTKGNKYLVKPKIKEIQHKFKLVYEEMNKNQLKILIDIIRKCYLQRLYMDFNPGEVIWKIGSLIVLKFIHRNDIFHCD